VRQAFRLAASGEPGPVAVTIPYNLLIEAADYNVAPPADPGLPFDDAAFEAAVALLSDKRHRVGIYAGYGCMDYSATLTRVWTKSAGLFGWGPPIPSPRSWHCRRSSRR